MDVPHTLCDGFHFTEDPRWHDGRLWFSDFFGHAVHSVGLPDVDGSRPDPRVELRLDDQPSGLGWLPDGRLLVVSMVERKVVRREHDGTLVTHAELSDLATWWCNDMLVDASGRAYVGNFGFDLDAMVAAGDFETLMNDAPTACVALVRPDGTTEVAADGLRFPNGTVLTPDGSTLIVAETLAMCLTAFDVGPDGSLSNRRTWADLGPAMVPPDGICLDVDGGIWVANAMASECVRVVEGGTITDRQEFSQRCFACALGGPDGRTLFACTAASENAARCATTTTAKIEMAVVTVAGAGSP